MISRRVDSGSKQALCTIPEPGTGGSSGPHTPRVPDLATTTTRGWRADPERAGRLRWWDGTTYQQDTIYPAVLDGHARWVRRLVLPLVVLLVATSALDLAAAGLHLRFLDFFANPDDVAPGSDTSLEQLELLADQLRLVTCGAMAAVAVTWAVWQYRAACMLPSHVLRYGPPMHAGAWFIPVVNLWRPLLTMHELRSGLVGSPAPRGIGVGAGMTLWWGLWLVSLSVWMVSYPLLYVLWNADQGTLLLTAIVVGKAAGAVAAQQAVLVVLGTAREVRDLAARDRGTGTST